MTMLPATVRLVVEVVIEPTTKKLTYRALLRPALNVAPGWVWPDGWPPETPGVGKTIEEACEDALSKMLALYG